MLPTVRSLLVALVLACSGVVLTQVPAHACTCADLSVKQHATRADAVFSGVLVRTSTGTMGQDRKVTVYDVAADTVFKGDLGRPQVQVVSDRGTTCGLGRLPADRRYVFFVVESRGSYVIDRCSGTGRAAAPLTGQIENVLGKGTDLTPREEPERVTVEFTRVADAEPATLTRLAAPGAALVLLGLLGLFVVRRAARRG